MATRSLDAIREIVQQLHAALESFRTNDPEPLAAAVQDYAAAVAEANGRLRAAHALLRQGRRADAVHACDIEPNVLESIAELDYSDQSLDSWLPTFDELGIPRPQRILTDLATELSAAYDVGHQLANLLRQHRLLAIARGPLEGRVKVLRRIIEIDPENPGWQEDLASYEHVCKRELVDELGRLGKLQPAAVTQPIAGRIKAIVQQLSSADWLEPLDGSAARRVQAVLTSVSQIQVLAELEQLAVQLADALATRNLSRAGELGDRWDELTAHATLPPDHPALEGAIRCLDWVCKERNRAATEVAEQDALNDLRFHVIHRVPKTPYAARTAANNLRAAMMRLPAVPASHAATADREELLADAADRLCRLERVAPWFWGRVVTASVATLAIVTFAAGMAWRVFHRSRVADEVREEVIDNLLAHERGEEGRTAWERWVAEHGWLAEHPITVEINGGLENLKQGAHRETGNARTHINVAARTVEGDVASRTKMIEEFDPQAGDIQSILSARRDVDSALKRASDQLEKADKAIAFVRAQIGHGGADPLAREHESARNLLNESRSRFDQSLNAAAARIKDQINRDLVALERNPAAPISRDQGDRVRQRIDEFETLDRTSADALRTSYQKLIDRDRVNLSIESLVAALDRAARSGLADYLDAVAKPGTKPEVQDLVESLSTVAADRPAIEAAVRWSALADAWAGDLSCDQATAAKWQRALELAMKTEPRPNCAPEETERLNRLLACFEERDERDTRHMERLRQTLEEPVMQPGVLMVQVEGGARYYTRNPEMNSRKCFSTEEKLGRFLANAAEAREPAPQTALAAAILEQLDSISSGEIRYEEGFIAILSLLDGKSTHRNCDPILQCKLIGHVVDALEELALFEDSKPLLRLSDRIAEKVGLTPRWVDPENRDKDVAKAAESIVNDREQLVAKVVKDYRERRAALENRPALIRSIVFHGWLDKRAGAEDLRLCREGSGADGGLYVVTTGADGFEFVAVGRTRDGKVSLDAKPRLMFGQPVFLSAPKEQPQDSK